MNKVTLHSRAIYRTQDRRECRDLRLVLESAGIAAQTPHVDGWWLVVVGDQDAEVAASEIRDYLDENPHRSAARPPAVRTFGGATAGVIVYWIVIAYVAFLTETSSLDLDWREIGSMQAGLVTAGELWRTVTALTLHLDVPHIGSNAIFGALFGYLAGRVIGGGVAWLTIVAAGALGNLVNAMIQDPSHTSIGASTAVFSALGIVVAHAIRPRPPVHERALKRWAPLIAGVVLLGLTGVGGERTDVAAHFTGFMAGVLFGWVGCRLPESWLASATIQWVAGVATILLVIASWILAIVSA